MIIIDVAFAVVIGLVFAALVYALLELRRGWLGWLMIFLLFFILPWFGGLWLVPFGPPVQGAFWLPPLVIAIFIFLILAAFTPFRRPLSRRVQIRQARQEAAIDRTVSVFFWLVIILAVAGIVAAYLT
jgi:hypothetical protein